MILFLITAAIVLIMYVFMLAWICMATDVTRDCMRATLRALKNSELQVNSMYSALKKQNEQLSKSMQELKALAHAKVLKESGHEGRGLS